MKIKTILVEFCVIFAIAMMTTPVTAEKTMLFVYNNDYAPFGWEENGAMQGIYIDIVNEVFKHRKGGRC